MIYQVEFDFSEDSGYSQVFDFFEQFLGCHIFAEFDFVDFKP